MDIKLIIFDWDGTLADTTLPIIRTVQEVFAECGLKRPADDAVRPLIGHSLPGIIARLLPDASDALRLRLEKLYALSSLNPNNNNMVMFADALPCLNTLRRQGYLLAVATGKGRTGLNGAIRQSGTADYWAATRCAGECAPKPAPDMIWAICDTLDIPPAHTLMVGDTVYDLQTAAHAGAHAVAVTTGAHSREQLAAAPQLALLDNLAALPHWLAAHNRPS